MEFMTQNALSLSELSLKIKMAIEGTLTQSYCVVAEIQSINQNRSGHAYLELIEKDLSGTQIISQLRATIWASKYRLLKPYFESSTGCTLSSAIASNLAKGFTLAESVKNAKDYISGALEAMLDLGKGSGPLAHNWNIK